MPARPWLPAVRALLGVLPDAEVARRAGVAQSTVTEKRNELGIAPSRRRDLAAVSRAEVLRLVRAREKAGKSMRGAPRDDARLASLCRYQFGGWYQAVEAAGLKTEGRARSRSSATPTVPSSPPKPRTLTTRLLRSDKSSAELERITGVPRSRIKSRRRSLGIVRDESQKRDRSWVTPALGELPDTEIAKRIGRTPNTVGLARRELGIPRAPQRLLASSEVRARLAKLSVGELRRLLAGLPPIDAAIVRDRILAERPATLAQIGARFGVSRQRVAQRERAIGGYRNVVLEVEHVAEIGSRRSAATRWQRNHPQIR